MRPCSACTAGAPQLLDAVCSTALGDAPLHGIVLHRWIDKEGIVLARKADISGEVRLVQGVGGVRFHLEEVVFVLPYKRNIFEFLQVVAMRCLRVAGPLILLVAQQEVVDELLSPLDDALYDMQGEHPQGVEDVDALIE